MANIAVAMHPKCVAKANITSASPFLSSWHIAVQCVNQLTVQSSLLATILFWWGRVHVRQSDVHVHEFLRVRLVFYLSLTTQPQTPIAYR